MSAISVSQCRSDMREEVNLRHLKNLDNQAYIEFATDINDTTGDQEDVSQGRRQLSALDFELINPALFLNGRPAVEPADESANEGTQRFIIHGWVVNVHLSVLKAAGLGHLASIGSVLPVYLKGRLDTWYVLLMAAYGSSALPDDGPSTTACTYVRACDLASDYNCSSKVRTRIFLLTLAYWSSFSLWNLHGKIDPEHEEHASLLAEINAAWRLHKTSKLRTSRFNKLGITDLAFGMVLSVHCPVAVLQVHMHILDADLREYMRMGTALLETDSDILDSNDMILVGFPRL